MTQARLAIIGGGPAGLAAAEAAATAGATVELYDAMPSVGRKFLLAGKGGLNLTHAEPFDAFMSRYGKRRDRLEGPLLQFGADAIRDWAAELGVATFVGSSRRVFPLEMKSAPLLRAWLRRLRSSGVRFHVRHRWQGWTEDGSLSFATPTGPLEVQPAALILALGGGSWARLGSDGAWLPWLRTRGIDVQRLRPSNCGFDVDWSVHFAARYAGIPVKPVSAHLTDAHGRMLTRRGEFVITGSGIEGSLVYALSAPIRDMLEQDGHACIGLDLAPDRTARQLAQALRKPRGGLSLGNHLKRAGLAGVKAGLLRERLAPSDFACPERLAAGAKHLPLPLTAARPLDKAISCAGGVAFEALDERLMLRDLPGVFCAGEMLDWEAPTGGYLLSACLATGRAAGLGAAAWLQETMA